MMKKNPIAVVVVILILIVGLVVFVKNKPTVVTPISLKSFDECAAAGYPILESFPEQCKTPDGQSFTKVVDNARFDTWKVYTNSGAKFTLKYPENWRLVENPNLDKGGTVQLFNYAANKYVGGEQMKAGDTKIEFAVLSNPDKLALRMFVQRQTFSGMSASQEHVHKAIVINGIDSIMDQVKDDLSYKSYYFKLNDIQVLVATISPAENSEASDIMSTIQI